jgi:outer membrane protein OmpA-like peptidoglycan-associated protein
VGNDAANFRLSGYRSNSVVSELEGAGIPSSRIHYRWIGEGEPYYKPWLVNKYQIRNKYDEFGGQTLNQSVTVYVFTPKST